MSRWLPFLLILGGCAYVSKGEFDDQWDKDGDGWPIGEDCDDSSDVAKKIFPFAPDVRGDKCDADCGATPDADGDDWPDDNDCNDDDPATFPCAPEASETDGIDNDCDGFTTTRADSCISDDPDFPTTEQTRFPLTKPCGCPAAAFGGDCDTSGTPAAE